MQHETKLYIVDHVTVARRLFYQQALLRFGGMARTVMDEPLPAAEMVSLALDLDKAGWRPEDGPKAELATNVAQLLQEKGPMLEEYFRISFDGEGCLRSLPILVEGHMPMAEAIPIFLFKLAA